MQKCMKSWEKFCPDYTIKKWDESNLPMDNPYIATAYRHKNWANISNIMRCYALYEEGGIYVDTDIELVRNIDCFMNDKCLMGWQKDSKLYQGVNNAVFGAEAGHPFVGQLIEVIEKTFDGTESADKSSPGVVSELLIALGVDKYHDEKFVIEDVTLYPRRYFYPFSWREKIIYKNLSQDTYCIHHWAHSWKHSRPLFRRVDVKRLFPKIFKKNITF